MRARNRWLLREPSDETPMRLFCLPYSGVGASMYARWPERSGPVELLPVQLPARENRLREPHFGTYEALATQLAEGLADLLDRPFGFFGHCGGALAAFATAWELHRSGGPEPACLLVSSQVAPHEGPYGRFLSMSEDQLRAELAGLTVAMGGEPRPDTLDLGMDTLRPDIAANRAYVWAEPAALSCDVWGVGWRDDDEVRPDRMSGWQQYAPSSRYFPVFLNGGHHSFLGPPLELLDVIRRAFARAARRVGRFPAVAAPEPESW